MVTSNPAARGSLIDGLASELLLSRKPEAPGQIIKDDSWIRQSFIVSTDSTDGILLDKIDQENRRFSSASLKYTDASIGGNTVINPPPQFTRYADIRDKGIRFDAKETSLLYEGGELGQGSYYAEALDDNMQQVHLQFGVAQMNSFTQFFTGFYSSDAGAAARTGRFTDGFYNKFLRLAGTVIGYALAPLAIIPLAILFAGTAVRYFMNWPTSKFYTMKPAMEIYWAAVNSMVNQIAINQGIGPGLDPAQTDSIIGKEHKFAPSDYSIFSSFLPNEFTKEGRIDVYAIATKSKRLQQQYDYLRVKAFKEKTGNNSTDKNTFNSEDYFGVVRKTLQDEKTSRERHPYASQSVSIEGLLRRYFDKAKSLSRFKDTDNSSNINKDGVAQSVEEDFKAPKEPTDQQKKSGVEIPYEPKTPPDGFLDYLFANEADGNQWVSFRVDYTGPAHESFTNSTAPSSLASKINAISSSSRDIRINYGGALQSVPGVKAIADSVMTVIGSVGTALNIEGLAAFAGSAFVDIPDHWESSVASLASSSYSFTLISPYGNPISQMFSIYVPLCALLAGGLPLATGKQSHTSPFLCTIHDRGRSIKRLAIIDSIQVTRGTSNLGFNREGKPMAVEVTFNVKDLSSIVAMPIQSGFNLLQGIFDGENSFSDYLMALSAMSLPDSIYRIPMLKYQLKRKASEIASFTSASSIASYVSTLPPLELLRAISRGTDKK